MSMVSQQIKKKAIKWTIGGGCSLPLVGILILILFICSLFAVLSSDEKISQGGIQEQYSEYVMEYAMQFDVSPALVFTVIKAESNFNPNAVSPVGARGLMQMMPTTFEGMKRTFSRMIHIQQMIYLHHK